MADLTCGEKAVLRNTCEHLGGLFLFMSSPPHKHACNASTIALNIENKGDKVTPYPRIDRVSKTKC